VLIGALAIPAVLFWKWWIAMQTTTTLEVKQKAPEAQTAFGDVKSAQINPIETAEQPPAQLPPAEGAAANPAAGSLDEAPNMNAAASTEPAAQGGEGEGEDENAQASQEQASTPPPRAAARNQPGVLRYAPKSARDPMVSIFDLRELAKRRLAKEMSRRQVKKALEPKPAAPAPVKVRKAPPPPPKPFCETVELQGIIATPNGIAAIIDDEVRSEGDVIKEVLIARITTRTVIFKRHGRTVCVKRVQR